MIPIFAESIVAAMPSQESSDPPEFDLLVIEDNGLIALGRALVSLGHKVTGAAASAEAQKLPGDASGTRGTSAPARVSAAECLETAIAHLQAALQQADADIQFHSLPDVVCHPLALVRIFQNLIANALTYRSHRQPEVYISAHRYQEFWTFAVTDNGIGFSRSKAEAIFELSGGAASNESGTQRTWPQQASPSKDYSGIDLALCRRLVEQHGGSIWAESSVGYGSTFFFTLPAETANTTVADVPKTSECQPF